MTRRSYVINNLEYDTIRREIQNNLTAIRENEGMTRKQLLQHVPSNFPSNTEWVEDIEKNVSGNICTAVVVYLHALGYKLVMVPSESVEDVDAEAMKDPYQAIAEKLEAINKHNIEEVETAERHADIVQDQYIAALDEAERARQELNKSAATLKGFMNLLDRTEEEKKETASE